MYSDYQAGMSLAAVSRKYSRSRRGMSEIFACRRLKLRPPPKAPPQGRFKPGRRLAEKEIAAIVARQTSIRIPEEIRYEWRLWPMSRRRAFIAAVRKHINHPDDRPKTPFSKNVIPWEYGSPEVMRVAYDGPRQSAGVKIKLTSQGVIWRGKIYFWSQPNTGYISAGPWTPEFGRPQLHHLIWAEANGRPVPPAHQVLFRDRNMNNLDPKNLFIRSKADCARINQAAGKTRNSRRMVETLLRNHVKQNENIGTFRAIRARANRHQTHGNHARAG